MFKMFLNGWLTSKTPITNETLNSKPAKITSAKNLTKDINIAKPKKMRDLTNRMIWNSSCIMINFSKRMSKFNGILSNANKFTKKSKWKNKIFLTKLKHGKLKLKNTIRQSTTWNFILINFGTSSFITTLMNSKSQNRRLSMGGSRLIENSWL